MADPLTGGYETSAPMLDALLEAHAATCRASRPTEITGPAPVRGLAPWGSPPRFAGPATPSPDRRRGNASKCSGVSAQYAPNGGGSGKDRPQSRERPNARQPLRRGPAGRPRTYPLLLGSIACRPQAPQSSHPTCRSQSPRTTDSSTCRFSRLIANAVGVDPCRPNGLVLGLHGPRKQRAPLLRASSAGTWRTSPTPVVSRTEPVAVCSRRTTLPPGSRHAGRRAGPGPGCPAATPQRRVPPLRRCCGTSGRGTWVQ